MLGWLVLVLAVVGSVGQPLIGTIIETRADLSRFNSFIQFGQRVNNQIAETRPSVEAPINTQPNADARTEWTGPLADFRRDLYDTQLRRTVLAPTNNAFAKLTVGTETQIQRGLNNNDNTFVNLARAILGYHEVANTVSNAELSAIINNGGFVGTFTGQYANRNYEVRVSTKHNRFFINDAMITASFIPAANGGVWIIDTLLTPPQCGFTNIAPEAFVWTSKDLFPGIKRRINDGNDATVWKNFLPRYHQDGNTMDVQLQFKRAVDVCQVQILWAQQMPQTRVRVFTVDIDGAVTGFQLATTNPGDYSILEFPSKDTFRVGIQLDPELRNDGSGIFQVQPRFMAIAEVYVYEEAASEGFSVYDIVAYDQKQYSWLAAALHITNLWKVLKEESNFVYTLFAPTDAAFRKLPPSVLETITMYEVPTLSEILFYHLVSNNVGTPLNRNDINGRRVINTLGGYDLEVARQGAWVNNALLSDQQAAVNGIVIPIDNVLIPPNLDVAAEGSLRLAGSGPTSNGSPAEGRVEIYKNGLWGTICDQGILTGPDNLNGAANRQPVRTNLVGNPVDPNVDRTSNVICRELGYISGTFMNGNDFPQSAPPGMPIHYQNPQCPNTGGTTTNLIQCSLQNAILGNNANECNSKDNLGIRCSVEGELSLSAGSAPWSGIVTIRTRSNNNNQLTDAVVCPRGWGVEEARVVCRQLGFHGGAPTTPTRPGNLASPVPPLNNLNLVTSVTFSGNNGCIGNERFLHECPGRNRLVDTDNNNQNTLISNCFDDANNQNIVAGVTCNPFAEMGTETKHKDHSTKLSIAEIHNKVRERASLPQR